MKKSNSGYTGRIIRLDKIGNKYFCYDPSGSDVTDSIPINSIHTFNRAFGKGKALSELTTSSGKSQWRQIEMSEFLAAADEYDSQFQATPEEISELELIKDYIHTQSISLRPDDLFMSDLSWKYLIRSVKRGKNIMMTGPSGCGKTFAAKCAASALGLMTDDPTTNKYFYFNLGATQDPRSTLVGNTHFDKDKGTFFSPSRFVEAIQVENAVILLDEISRAHPEAANILLPVLDYGQRYLSLDEKSGSPTIKVADGVTFIATANIGSEYTTTRVMDRALLDRFTRIEMEVLDKVSELKLLRIRQPAADTKSLEALADIADHTRKLVKNDDSRITDIVSTRMNEEMAELIADGFNLEEVAEIGIYPFYPDDGIDSERCYMKQYVQQFLETELDSNQYS